MILQSPSCNIDIWQSKQTWFPLTWCDICHVNKQLKCSFNKCSFPQPAGLQMAVPVRVIIQDRVVGLILVEVDNSWYTSSSVSYAPVSIQAPHWVPKVWHCGVVMPQPQVHWDIPDTYWAWLAGYANRGVWIEQRGTQFIPFATISFIEQMSGTRHQTSPMIHQPLCK